MGDESEKTCPLCAEEMDLTDQQLRPCKCGYQICVWCWHHIMDMADKDVSEGRCPACRKPYDKEKIVGMGSSCERLVAEIGVERKKSHKGKSKSSDGRKQLSSVRVIQRNLVYITGLPLNLADEDLLYGREYFGQYGKVLKVSMTRTATGVIQQFPNSTCSVYITYTKEEEAIRCIQSVHGFILDSRPLKACFGTTKYCHAWLRNMACNNPDCLYLHEIGSEEDSFTKDEIISAYTRSRVQQITGATNNLQRRAGNVLPPPMDGYCSSITSVKSVVKSTPINTAGVPKNSSLNENSSRSVSLPAAASWGVRASDLPAVSSLTCSNGPSKENTAANVEFLSKASNKTQLPNLQSEVSEKPDMLKGQTVSENKPDLLKSTKQHTPLDFRAAVSEKPASSEGAYNSILASSSPVSTGNDRNVSMPSNILSNLDHTEQSYEYMPIKEETAEVDGNIQTLVTERDPLSIDRSTRTEHSGMVTASQSSLSDNRFIKSLGYEGHYPEEQIKSSTSLVAGSTIKGDLLSGAESDARKDPQSGIAANTTSDMDDDIISFNRQRLNDPEVTSSGYKSHSTNLLRMSSHSGPYSQYSGAVDTVSSRANSFFIDNKDSDRSILSNGYRDRIIGGDYGSNVGVDRSFLFPNTRKEEKQMGRFLGDADGIGTRNTGEEIMMSNIMSLDLDESFASPQNLAKFLGEAEKQTDSLKHSSSWQVQNNNQSRFSFARQDGLNNQAFEGEPLGFRQSTNGHHIYQDTPEYKDLYSEKFSIFNGSSSNYFEGSGNYASNPSSFSSTKLSVGSRAQVSAPPGFSNPSRAPPPGFSSHEQMNQTFQSSFGNHLVESPSFFNNSYQAPPARNVGGVGDIAFNDPAILAVGKGRPQMGNENRGLDMRLNFPPHLSNIESEARLQLLMQRSLSPHQNSGFPDNRDNNISTVSDSYGRLMEQSQAENASPFGLLSFQQSRSTPMSNGHWDGWSGIQNGSNLSTTEHLRNERRGYNKYYNLYEEPMVQTPSSENIYHRTFGI